MSVFETIETAIPVHLGLVTGEGHRLRLREDNPLLEYHLLGPKRRPIEERRQPALALLPGHRERRLAAGARYEAHVGLRGRMPIH